MTKMLSTYILFIWLCLFTTFPMLAQDNARHKYSEIERTMNDFIADLNAVNEDRESAQFYIKMMSGLYASPEFFNVNGVAQKSFSNWVSQYCSVNLEGTYVVHSLDILQHTLHKVDKHSTDDKRYRFDAILKRVWPEAESTSDKVTFTIVWNGSEKYVHLIDIDGTFSDRPFISGQKKTTSVHNIKPVKYDKTPTSTNTCMGVVFDRMGNPAKGIRIQVERKGAIVIHWMSTDYKGEFFLTGLLENDVLLFSDQDTDEQRVVWTGQKNINVTFSKNGQSNSFPVKPSSLAHSGKSVQEVSCTGTVFDKKGRGARGIWVLVERNGKIIGEWNSTNYKGEFKLTGLCTNDVIIFQDPVMNRQRVVWNGQKEIYVTMLKYIEH